MTREEILKEALRCVTGEREQQYGSPEDSFEVIADLWMTYLEKKTVPDTGLVALNPEDVAAMMALLKIARICTGKYKGDNWVDLAGYAACGGACQSGSRPVDWELEDEEDRRMEAKLEKVNAYCRLHGDCDSCPVRRDDILFSLCHERAFEAMDEEDLDSYLAFFRGIAAKRREPNCYSCKYMACDEAEEPCYSCTHLNKYEEDMI